MLKRGLAKWTRIQLETWLKRRPKNLLGKRLGSLPKRRPRRRLGRLLGRWLGKIRGKDRGDFWVDDCQEHLSQPYFCKSVRMTFTLLKWGLGSPLGLSKLQSSIARVKTTCIEVFLISLKSYQSVDVENGLA
jgi:hypothetical protein